MYDYWWSPYYFNQVETCGECFIINFIIGCQKLEMDCTLYQISF